MGDQVTTTVIAGAISLVGTFGSILLNHHLETRRRQAPASIEPISANQGSAGVGLLVPLTTVLFAVGIGYFSQLRDSSGQDSYKVFSAALPVAAVLLLWWRARRAGAGYWAFLLDVLILSAGWVVGVRFSRAQFNTDAVSIGVIFFVISAVLGGFVLLATRRGRRAVLPT